MIDYIILSNEQSFVQELQLIDPSLFGNVQTVSVVSDSTSTTTLAPAIAPPATAPAIAPNNNAPPTITTATSDDGVSKGIIIGIVIVVTIGLISAIVLVGQYRQSNRNKNKNKNGNNIYPMSKIRIPTRS